jgi:hypothetical protein
VAGAVAVAVALAKSQPLVHLTSGACCDGASGEYTAMVAGNLLNKGRISLRVTEIEVPAWVEARTDSRGPASDEPADVRGARRFRPFELGGGEHRWVALVSRLPRCGGRMTGGLRLLDRVRIRFELLGLHRSGWVDVTTGAGEALALAPGRRCVELAPVEP